MLTKTKLALAIALVAGTASVALAQDADPNLLNRYPAYNGAHGVGDAAEIQIAPRSFQSAPVGLHEGNVGLTQSTTGRPQVETFRYDSSPLISGGGY